MLLSHSRLARSLRFVALSTTLAGGTPLLARAAGPATEGFEDAMARAGALSEQGEHAQALESFEAAFEAMPPEIQVGSVGEFVAYGGGRSAIQVFNGTGDRTALERGKALLRSFVSAVDQADASLPKASTERALSTLSMIDGMLAEDSAENEEASDPVPPDDDPIETPIETPPPTEPPKAKPDRAGLALTITGGLAIAGGVATIVAGTQQVPWYEGELEHFGWDPSATDYDYEAKLDEARRIRNIDIGVGAGLSAVGVGLLIYGIVRLRSGGRAAKQRASLGGGLATMARSPLPGARLDLRF